MRCIHRILLLLVVVSIAADTQAGDAKAREIFSYEPIAGSVTFMGFDHDFDPDSSTAPAVSPYAGYRWTDEEIRQHQNGERDFIRVVFSAYPPVANGTRGMKQVIKVDHQQVMIDKLGTDERGEAAATATSTANVYTEAYIRIDGARLKDLIRPTPQVYARHFRAAGVTVYSMPLVTFEGKTHALHLFVSRSMKRIADFVKLEGDKDYFKRHFPETQKTE